MLFSVPTRSHRQDTPRVFLSLAKILSFTFGTGGLSILRDCQVRRVDYPLDKFETLKMSTTILPALVLLVVM